MILVTMKRPPYVTEVKELHDEFQKENLVDVETLEISMMMNMAIIHRLNRNTEMHHMLIIF